MTCEPVDDTELLWVIRRGKKACVTCHGSHQDGRVVTGDRGDDMSGKILTGGREE